MSRGGLTLLSSSLSVEGECTLSCGCASPLPASAFRLKGRVDKGSGWRKHLKEECSRYAGRANGVAATGLAFAPRTGEVLCALVGRPFAVLRMREMEEGLGGMEGGPAPLDASARMILGSNVVMGRAVARMGMEDDGKDRAGPLVDVALFNELEPILLD
jgi:hypothetical protein